MKTIEVEITGISPLLMHRFSEEDRAQIESGTSHATSRPSKEDAAERAAYRLPSNGTRGNLYLPVEALLAAIRRAAAFRKLGKRSAVPAVCAGVFISPAAIDLGTSDYATDSRPVVIASTKGRVIRHRPRLDQWRARFTVEYDPELIPNEELVRNLLDDAGKKIGLLDFRPERKGPFGRFLVSSWQGRER